MNECTHAYMNLCMFSFAQPRRGGETSLRSIPFRRLGCGAAAVFCLRLTPSDTLKRPPGSSVASRDEGFVFEFRKGDMPRQCWLRRRINPTNMARFRRDDAACLLLPAGKVFVEKIVAKPVVAH